MIHIDEPKPAKPKKHLLIRISLIILSIILFPLWALMMYVMIIAAIMSGL
jgi:hypothetical protein